MTDQPTPQTEAQPEWITLAADIRAVDGNHDLGAGALAAALTARGWSQAAAQARTEARLPDESWCDCNSEPVRGIKAGRHLPSCRYGIVLDYLDIHDPRADRWTAPMAMRQERGHLRWASIRVPEVPPMTDQPTPEFDPIRPPRVVLLIVTVVTVIVFAVWWPR